MESRAELVQFQLPVTWDIAMRVLKHAARNGRTPFEIHLQGNGYLQVRQARALRPTITIDITFLAIGPFTTVRVADVTRRVSRRERQRIAGLIEQFRSDAEYFAAHTGALDVSTGTKPERPSPPSIGEFSRLRGASLD